MSLFHPRGGLPAATTRVLPGRPGTSLPVACALAAVLVGCAAPAPTPESGGIAPGSAGVKPLAHVGPGFATGGPGADAYGARNGYPIGDRSTFANSPFIVGSFSHLDRIFESRLIRRATTPSALSRAPSEPALRHDYAGDTLTLDGYLARNPTTGFLVARGDTILVERYQYSRTDRHRLASWSMAKTVISILIGIAIGEGRIRSIDDPAAAYVPALAGTEYGRTPIRHLLHMASGVRFVERYTGQDDLARLLAYSIGQGSAGGVDTVKPFNERVRPSGTRFSYASAETQVLGLVLRSAVGRPVGDYLQEKIWEPIGAEADATWLVDRAGQEATWCCLNAILRDYARLGLLLAHDGQWRGRQIIPATWMADATRAHSDQRLRVGIEPGNPEFAGYGYQVWILPGERRTFFLSGLLGQLMFVDPGARLVMVHTAVRTRPADLGAEIALWRGVMRELGR
ncbi:MAG TPA: serine hydrolase [Methylomirabilota bacterium]|nr:serine hydrolase [Methylomirabilota bacterium]